MQWKEQVSRQQMMWMYANGLLGSSLLFLPQLLAAEAKQDGWIAALLGGGAGLLILLLYLALARRFPGRTPVEYFQIVLGKPLGIASILIVLAYLLWVLLAMQREVTDFFSITYPETPTLFVALCFTLIEVYMVLHGLEVIARVHDLLFPLVIIGVLALFAVAFPQYRFDALKPLLSAGLPPVLAPLGIHISFPYGNAIAFLMIFPFIRKTKDLPYAAISGSLIGSAIFTVVTLFTLLTIGPASAARVVYPPHFGARTITIAGFLAGLDGVVDVIWIASNTLRVVTYRYAILLIIARLLGVSSYRYLVIPVSALTLVCSLNIYTNLGEHIAFINFPERYMAPIAFLLVPLTVLIVALIRKIDYRRMSHE